MQGVKNKMAQAKEASAASLGKMNSQLSQSMQATGAMSAFGATKNAGLKFKPKVKKGQEDEPVVEYKPSKYVEGDIIAHGTIEKCSDGKKATSIGGLMGNWQTRYVVMTMQGLWWFKTEAEFLEDPENTKAKGVFDRLEEAEINFDESRMWIQFVSGDEERVLSLRPVDRYSDMEKWIRVIEKKKLGVQPEDAQFEAVKGGVVDDGRWDEHIVSEWGKVTADHGASMHGVRSDGNANWDEMIGYLTTGDKVQIAMWPSKQVEMDDYGYPNVKVKVGEKHKDYPGQIVFVELKVCTFDVSKVNAKLAANDKRAEAAEAKEADKSGLEKRYSKKDKKEKKKKPTRAEMLGAA